MGTRSERLGVIAAFGVIYLVWGSTYLAIRVGLETLPPFVLASIRFLTAGGALYGALRLAGVPRPSDRQWWSAAVTGTLMLGCGVGGVTWAEQRITSGVAALLVATVPLWMTLLEAWQERVRPKLSVLAGVVVGLVGVAVLLGPSQGAVRAVDPLGAAVVLAGAVCWSVGSMLSRSSRLPSSPMMTVAVQMVSAGVVLLAVSGLQGEWRPGIEWSAISGRSVLALIYLAVFGSILSLSAYQWLLQRVSASAVSTYAFVNPVVAVALGWVLAGERLGVSGLVAAAVIVAAVALVWAGRTRSGVVERVAEESARPLGSAPHCARPSWQRPEAACARTIDSLEVSGRS